jgi:cysteine synthase A
MLWMKTMRVTINGKAETVAVATLADLLAAKKMEPRMVTVEHNGKIIPRDQLPTVSLAEEDQIELIFFMGGGSYSDVTQLIGKTPMVRLHRFAPDVRLFAKVEFFNPGGSVKDRICLSMIEAAEREGKLRPGATLVEPTSGNTGIGLALICATRGYKLILVMPESMSMERASLLSSYGADLVLTPGWEGMRGAIKEAESILEKNPTYFMPNQFSNPANPEAHRRGTGPEILQAMQGKRIDAFVTAVGTGGTLTGVGEVLKAHHPGTLIVAVEPEGSPVLSGGAPGPHQIQGIGAGFIPAILNRNLIDRVVTVSDDDAYHTAKQLARQEGLLVGISSGCNAFAARKIAQELGPDQTVVTVLPDTGERYISIEKYFNLS